MIVCLHMSMESFSGKSTSENEQRKLSREYDAYLFLHDKGRTFPGEDAANDPDRSEDIGYPAIFHPKNAESAQEYLHSLKNNLETPKNEPEIVRGITAEIPLTPEGRGRLRAYQNIKQMENEEASSYDGFWRRLKGWFRREKRRGLTLEEQIVHNNAVDSRRAMEKFVTAPASLTKVEKRLLGLEKPLVKGGGEESATIIARRKLYENPTALTGEEIFLLSDDEEMHYLKWLSDLEIQKRERALLAKKKLLTDPSLLTPDEVLSLGEQEQKRYADWLVAQKP